MMNETNKRKERIKTFLIIFLVILLILTFFSNTIQNMSLPVVSAQYASYGTITERVRGTAVITANQNYEVAAEGNRTVSKVYIKAGDEVRAGQTLFDMEAVNSEEEVKAAEEAVKNAELAYQKALLTAVPDYASQNQEIANARADLQTAVNRLNDAKRNGSGVSASAYQAAKEQASASTDKIEKYEAWMTALTEKQISGLPEQYRTDLEKKAADAVTADAELAATQASLAEKEAAITVTSAQQEQTIRDLERAEETAKMAYDRAKADYAADSSESLLRAMEDAEQAWRYAKEDTASARTELERIAAAEKGVENARIAVDSAQKEADRANAVYADAADFVQKSLNAELSTEKEMLRRANDVIASYENSSGEDIASLEEAVRQQERTIQNLLISLSQTQKDDKLAQQLNALDLQAQLDGIDALKEELEALKKDSGKQTVVSKNDGVVSAVMVSAGDSVPDGSVLAQINLTDSGYTASLTVSQEQAKKVKIGATADATTSSYSSVDAKLVAIKPDTETPGSTSKILVFEISGRNVNPGESVSLSLSGSSANYDCVIPKSAVMEDSEGKFVLIVNAKNTPLGNRYYVNRCAVTLLASDEISCAVQGEVNSWDFIVTASEKPLTSGMQVRMED